MIEKSIENLQEKLDNLYLSYLDRILKDKEIIEAINNNEMSSPLFIDIKVSQGNYKRPFKVLYVGQENNGWFSSKQRENAELQEILHSNKNKYLEALKKLYTDFDIGREYSSPIFNYLEILIHQMQEKKGGEESTGFLWTNLIRHSGDYEMGTFS